MHERPFDELESFVAIGQNYWCKDITADSAIENWLKGVNYSPRTNKVTLVGIDADESLVSVDEMGNVVYPKGVEIRNHTYVFDQEKLDRLKRCSIEMETLISDLSEGVYNL